MENHIVHELGQTIWDHFLALPSGYQIFVVILTILLLVSAIYFVKITIQVMIKFFKETIKMSVELIEKMVDDLTGFINNLLGNPPKPIEASIN